MTESAVFVEAMANSVKFYQGEFRGLTAYGQTPYWRTIQPWQSGYNDQPYVQKVCYNDELTIQLHVPFAPGWGLIEYPPMLYICDEWGTELSPNLNVAGYLKGYQVTGNTDTNLDTGIVTPLLDVCWSFKMGYFFGSTANTLPSTYYLRCDYYQVNEDNTAGDVISAYSEPMLLADAHDNTQQFQCTYAANNKKFEVIQGGWFNDWATGNHEPYQLTFGMRMESFVIPARTGPKGVNIGYLQQQYMQVQNQTTLLLPIWDLKVGENCLGIPWYMLEKGTAYLFADKFALLNMGDSLPMGFKVYNTNNSSSPADVWKVRAFDDVDSLLKASCVLQQTASRSLYTPTTNPISGRVFDGVFDGVFA